MQKKSEYSPFKSLLLKRGGKTAKSLAKLCKEAFKLPRKVYLYMSSPMKKERLSRRQIDIYLHVYSMAGATLILAAGVFHYKLRKECFLLVLAYASLLVMAPFRWERFYNEGIIASSVCAVFFTLLSTFSYGALISWGTLGVFGLFGIEREILNLGRATLGSITGFNLILDFWKRKPAVWESVILFLCQLYIIFAVFSVSTSALIRLLEEVAEEADSQEKAEIHECPTRKKKTRAKDARNMKRAKSMRWLAKGTCMYAVKVGISLLSGLCIYGIIWLSTPRIEKVGLKVEVLELPEVYYQVIGRERSLEELIRQADAPI
ncbi:uncharacterized protein NEMAJ01_0738 [Nematocida major]|uniref:uncharacterized protein n=1 Tax=Nematocida major TaxID=1912982 RepID=UPI002007DAFF|nr:uncharacterized protein NEMAJ01_0738 [Nematocida major]KAH9385842.1 hypothetical protein NEMAJ01_0738 [Nematocida major]